MAYTAANAVAFCQRQVGRYGNGECWTLVEDAVVGAGGKSSRVLTPRFSPTASFVWGTVAPLSTVQVGDCLQFSRYSWTRTTATQVRNPDGSGTDSETVAEETRGEPQHSAIVVRVVSTGVVEVIEQNIPPLTGPVQTVTLVLSAPATSTTTTTRTPLSGGGERVTTVTVTDTVSNAPRCYRPIAA
jgi:hypothetical protein